MLLFPLFFLPVFQQWSSSFFLFSPRLGFQVKKGQLFTLLLMTPTTIIWQKAKLSFDNHI